MEKEETLVQVDIETILQHKAKKYYRFIPRFLIRYLKTIVHQDEINDVLRRSYQHYYGTDFADFLIEDFGVKITVVHEEKIPESGKLIVVSNHPLGGFDGIAIISTISKTRKDILFPVNDLLMHVPNLKPIFIPINKTGSNSTDLARKMNEAFNSEHTILYFPAGLCSRKRNGKIMDLEWKKTFISKAKQYGHDVLPIYFDGKNSNFFYRLANLRKFFGIKFNIEMLYLADEFFKQKGSAFTITIGDVIKNEELQIDKDDFVLAEKVKEKVYALKKQ